MQLKMAKADLEHGLHVAQLAVGSKDLSGHYLFRVKGGQLFVCSFDLRLFAAAPIVAEIEGASDGDSFTVEAWRLTQWVQGVQDGVLTFLAEGAEVTASGSKTKVRFRSLDAGKWPHNDVLVAAATSMGSANPAGLSRALNLTRWFASADDTSKPELCQIEIIEGTLWATDRRALSSVEVPGLPDLNMRLPAKDVGSVLRFLGGGLETVELRGSERPDGGGACALFVRPDGAYLGVARPATKFPALKVDRDDPVDTKLSFDRSEFKAAISLLMSAAPEGHEAVTFRFDPNMGASGTVLLQVPCEAGGMDEYPLTSATVSNPAKWQTDFSVNVQYLVGIGDTFGLERVEFGIKKAARGGFVNFLHREEGDQANVYYSVIVWRT